jgi:hypothetical protein
MSGRPSKETTDALRDVARGKLTAYAAAKKHGIALSTIYRALARERTAKKKRSRKL